jgi:hypothetical protein
MYVAAAGGAAYKLVLVLPVLPVMLPLLEVLPSERRLCLVGGSNV